MRMCHLHVTHDAGRSGETFGASKPGDNDTGAVDVGKVEEKVRPWALPFCKRVLSA